MTKEEITGIILAGGKSSRMGRDKGLCSFNGKALVSYAIETLQPFCDRIIISANNDIEEYSTFGLEVVADEAKGIGPMGGILSCLKKSSSQHNLILSCDTPFVAPALFEYLLKEKENYQLVIPKHQNTKLEPLAAYYATNVIADLIKSIQLGDYKMMNFIERVNSKIVAVDELLPSSTDKLFLNLNTPEDLLRC